LQVVVAGGNVKLGNRPDLENIPTDLPVRDVAEHPSPCSGGDGKGRSLPTDSLSKLRTVALLLVGGMAGIFLAQDGLSNCPLLEKFRLASTRVGLFEKGINLFEVGLDLAQQLDRALDAVGLATIKSVVKNSG
jgi:hypothetical protein